MSADSPKSSEKTDPLIGRVIHDRFRIIAPIARGGMGAVYKAEQAPLGRLVALKVLSPKHDVDKDPEFRKRFFLEAATVAKLTHPNTVTVFDYGQGDGGLYFIAMELLEGVTLKHALRESGPFPPERAIHVTKQICRSLREAHRLGIVHRDMKPGNVMLLEQGDEKDFVKLLDFGLVKDTEAADEEDLTQAGVFMGSPKYMSPEQIQGERVDGRSDIYSVGVIFFELLTGRPPFEREKQVQILMDHLNAPIPAMSSIEGHPPVPGDLEAIVRKCLAKKREERFADMDALLLALKALEGDVAPSGELGISGEHGPSPSMGPGTPVSGIHSLGMPSITPPGHSDVSLSGAVVAAASAPAGPSRSSMLPLALGAVALAAIGGGLALWAFGGAGEPAQATNTAVAQTPAAATPAPDPQPQQELTPLPAPPPARTLLVNVSSTPPGATVRVGDREYGPTPAQIELSGALAEPGAQIDFVFTMTGFREASVTEHAPQSGTLEVGARLRRFGRGPGVASSNEEGGRTVTPPGYRDSPY